MQWTKSMEPELSTSPDINELLSSLPACRRCRSNKRRCDTQLPSCRNCSKAGADCIFFDHITERNISRSYVLSLIQRLQNGQKKGNTQNDDSSLASSIDSLSSDSEIKLQTSHYIGPLSCLSAALSIAKNTETEAAQAPTPPCLHFQRDLDLNLAPNQESIDYLISKYVSDIQNVYPILDETLPCLSPGWSVEHNEADLTPRELFMLELIYSIASHQVIAQSSNYEKIYYYQKLADSCHRKARFIFDKAATDISIGTLETVTLAALHSLLSPQTGNIGQLIGLAARLAIDLGAVDRPHINSNEENKIEQIYKSVYCLENQYATALDRPGLLPPPVIDPESRISQDILCLIYQIQSRFRLHRGNVDSTPLLQELDGYFSTIEQMSIRSRGSILATVYETRLLIQPDDEESAVCLLDIYSQRFYIRTALSPSWAYRAGLVVISRAAHLHPDAIQKCGGGLHKRYQAYGNCLLFLEQCSRRWPSANALRMSLQEVFSKASGMQ